MSKAGERVPTELVSLPGGRFQMGSDFYPEEGPVREVYVPPFGVERHPVTNTQFAAFVEDSGYLTVAERPLDLHLFPGADPQDLVPGGLVFRSTPGPVPLDRWDLWWHWQPGANWRRPKGPGDSIEGKERHPVVLVAYEDAQAYARWAGRELPTEVEFEYAAWGGAGGTRYAWGDDLRPGGNLMANTWQGRFPYANNGANGWRGTSPVGSFPPNSFGLVDLIGNVWEWTSTYFSVGAGRTEAEALTTAEALPTEGEVSSCCGPQRDQLAMNRERALAVASAAPGELQPRRVLKGGSHLCAPEYCLRYRPPARSPQSVDSATTHVGFRCVVRDIPREASSAIRP